MEEIKEVSVYLRIGLDGLVFGFLVLSGFRDKVVVERGGWGMDCGS